jgi:hypothetical protein
MTLPFSGSQIDKLGVRLRDQDVPTEADLRMLSELLIAHDGAMRLVADSVREIGVEPTTRLKSTGMIIEKLRRSRKLTLRHIQDLAGARVVRPMTLDEQDELVRALVRLWPDATVVDRRVTPSFGYRAVHVIPRVDGCRVEVQLRTRYQNTWAQVMETLGDVWGRQIRYGGAPDAPDEPIAPDNPTTRADVVSAWIQTADQLAELARRENDLDRLASHPAIEEIAPEIQVLEAEIDSSFGSLRTFIRSLYEDFG